MTPRISVTVPATTANLGPGLDCIGLALNLYNRVTFEESSAGLSVSVKGEGKGIIPEDETNLVVRAAERVFQLAGRRPAGLRVVQENQIPVKSGLGSSAAAVLAGILAANGLVGKPLNQEDILALASEIEGHPDNVAPALYGGLTLIVNEAGKLIVTRIPIHEMSVAVVLPEFNLTTAEARAALPTQVPLADAIYNAGRVGLLVRALETGDYHALRVATQDKLHQPYRLPLIPGLTEVFEAGQAAGAAVALSGAGPSVIAFAPAGHQDIAIAMGEAFATAGLKSRYWVLSVSRVHPALAELID
jgi:homoserine kinase